MLCSHAEGMSNALLEYMAAGRPIVATAVGAAPELIEDGVHGLLVPARTTWRNWPRPSVDCSTIANWHGGWAMRRGGARWNASAARRWCGDSTEFYEGRVRRG